MSYLNETHDPKLQSWVVSANAQDNGFPIQNLPFGVFRPIGGAQDFRPGVAIGDKVLDLRSEEHTSELQSLMRISYAVFCLKKKKKKNNKITRISTRQHII